MVYCVILGPNVFVDSTGFLANNDSGPHERFAMGILYDNIACRTINVRQRLWMGSGQGWAGKCALNESHLVHVLSLLFTF